MRRKRKKRKKEEKEEMSDEEKGEEKVHIKNEVYRGQYLKKIEDTGLVISEEDMRRSFTENFQKDKTTPEQKEKLIDWFVEHTQCPYFLKNKKERKIEENELVENTGVDIVTIRAWFKEARCKHWIPMVVSGKNLKRNHVYHECVDRVKNIKKDLSEEVREEIMFRSGPSNYSNVQKESLVNWFVKNWRNPFMSKSDLEKFEEEWDIEACNLRLWLSDKRRKWKRLMDKFLNDDGDVDVKEKNEKEDSIEEYDKRGMSDEKEEDSIEEDNDDNGDNERMILMNDDDDDEDEINESGADEDGFDFTSNLSEEEDERLGRNDEGFKHDLLEKGGDPY